MIGEYRYADRFEDVGRVGRGAGRRRGPGARCAGPRRSTRPGSTSSSGSPGRWSPGTRRRAPGCSSPRTAEFGRGPDLRRAGQPRRLHPQAGGPGRRRRRGDGRQVRGRRRLLRTTSPTGTARASRPAAPRRTSRCGRRSSSSTRWLADPGRRGPDARGAGPAGGRRRRRAGASGCWPSSEAGAAGRRALPRRAARRGRPARPARRAVRADPPARRRRGLREAAAVLHDRRHRRRRRSTRSGCGRSAALEEEYRALGPEVVGTDDVRTSSRRCARTRRCTTPARTRSSRTPRPRWPAPAR